jgi:hypothetical protein
VAADKDDEKAKGDKAEEKAGEEKPKRGTGPTATRQQKRREERLKLIEEQVADGSLTIRQMTPAERKANPPKNLRKKKR